MLIATAALACCIGGCGSGEDPPVTPALPAGCDAAVSPGSDDQTAVQTAFIEATEGSTICLGAGTFSFTTELSLSTSGVTVRGAGREATTLDFKGQTVGANGLTITGDGVTVTDFQVKNTPGDGIRATEVKDIHFVNVSVVWDAKASKDNGAYGLYPVGSDGVIIEGCVVSGARDAGVYVGQSKRILVAHTEAFGNVAGIEIENSSDAEVRDNNAHDNTGGILVFNLPNLPVQDGRRAKVHHNIIKNNNQPTFASAGSVVSRVPRGTGIALVASDGNEFHDNEIEGNTSVGVLMLSYSDLLFGHQEDLNFNPYPEGNWFHDNRFEGNGKDPADDVKLFISKVPVPDFIWDGCIDTGADNSSGALTNCLSNNGSATYQNMEQCGAVDGDPSDISKVTCEHEALPPQAP